MTLILISAMERFMKIHLVAADCLILKSKYAVELRYLQNAEIMNPTIRQHNSVPVAEFLQNMATALTNHQYAEPIITILQLISAQAMKFTCCATEIRIIR